MPGTILVSVVEFMDLPFSSPPSSISIKVSMGKREYQTWDKGDFSFPLTTLRDNLIVVIQDAEGNEISQGGVETKFIVEKGLWDEFFPLKGGGQIHMKLQFVLSEDERNRIRMMRESVMKKKDGELLDCRTSSVEFATDDRSKVALPSCHMISDKNEEAPSAIPLSQGVDVHLSSFSHRESNEKVETQSLSAKTPTRVLYSKESPSSLESSESGSSSGRRVSLEKIPSSVKKMISAFETNEAQEIRPQIKPPPAKLQVNKIGLDLKEGKTVNMKTVQGTGKLEELSTTKVKVKGINISQLKQVHKEVNAKEKNSHEDLIRTSKFETSSAAERMIYQHKHQSHNDSDKQSSGGSSIVEESQSQSSTIGGASSHDLRSVADYEDMDDSFIGFGAWIFPDQVRRFCVTTGGKKLMDFIGGYSVKPEIQEKKMNFSISEKPKNDGGTGSEVDRDKKTHKVKKSKLKSEDVESSTGPVGQVMKVAIMVGFGILVLFTRQRK